MKTNIKITIISIFTLFLFTKCNVFQETKSTTEVEAETTIKVLYTEVKANETNVVNLKFDDVAASFTVQFNKQENANAANYEINMTNNAANNDKTPISFAGKSNFIRDFISQQDLDEKMFLETGTTFLRGHKYQDYTVTDVNSITFNDSNFAVFKVLNKNTNKSIYGWLNFTITKEKITFVKMGYSNQMITSIDNKQI
jgi:hypothetical protein